MRSCCLVTLACALFVPWSPAVVAASETDASGIYCQGVGETQREVLVCLLPPEQTTVDLEQDLLPRARSFNSAVNVGTTMTVFAHGATGSQGKDDRGFAESGAGGPGGYAMTTTSIEDIADALDDRPILNYFTATKAGDHSKGGASSLVALGELLQIEDDAQTPEESGILLIAGGGGGGGHGWLYWGVPQHGYDGGRGGRAIADAEGSVSGAGAKGGGSYPGGGGHEGRGGAGRRGQPEGGHGIGGPGGSSHTNNHWVGPGHIDQLRRANGDYFGTGGEGDIGGGGGWGGGGATGTELKTPTYPDSGGGGGGSFALRSTRLSVDDAEDAMWEVMHDQGLVRQGQDAVPGTVGVVFSVSVGTTNPKTSYQVYYNHDREIWRADVTARLYGLDEADVVKTRLIEDTGVGVNQFQGYGLGVDQVGNSLYWSTGTSIMRSTLDGDDAEPFVEELGGNVWNFEVDSDSRAIYWIETDSDSPGYSIWRAGLDEAVGTPVELCSEDTNISPFWANLTIDTSSRRAIWSDNTSEENRALLVQDLDVLEAKAGSGASCDPEVLPTPAQQNGEHPTDPRKTYSGLAATNGDVYWMSSPGGSSDRTPRSIPIDGGDGTMVNHDELRFKNLGGSALASGMDARKSDIYQGFTVIADAGLSGVRLMHLLSVGVQTVSTGQMTFPGAASSDVVIVLDPPN